MNPIYRLKVTDPSTGRYPDLCEVALKEQWAKHLMYCDMEGFSMDEEGALLLHDECGGVAYVPDGRFTWDFISENDPLTASHARLVKALEASLRLLGPRDCTAYPGALKKGNCRHGRFVEGRFHCPECDYETITAALAEARALTGEGA